MFRVLPVFLLIALALARTSIHGLAESRKALLKSGGWVTHGIRDYYVDYQDDTYGTRTACSV